MLSISNIFAGIYRIILNNTIGKIAILDNISEVESPAPLAYIVDAIKDFIPDRVKYVIGNAWRILNFRTHEPL